jgi:hypothetical protein
MGAELDALTKALPTRKRPLVAIVGGSKVSTKLILKSLADKVDQLIVGGGIANTFLLAAGKNIGKSLAEADLVPERRPMMDKMKARGAEVPLAGRRGRAARNSRACEAGPSNAGDVRRRRRHDLDIGPKSRSQAGRNHRQGRHHRLERPGRRLRVRRSSGGTKRWRAPSPDRRPSLDRRRRRHARRHRQVRHHDKVATSRPAAAPSWSSSKGKTLPAVDILLKSAGKIRLTVDRRHPWGAALPEKTLTPCTRFTKIVATLGPASSTRGARTHGRRRRRRRAPQLLARHGRRPPRRARPPSARGAAKVGRTVGILADLQGPKIRVGKFADGKVSCPGDPSSSTPSASWATQERVGLDYKDLPNDVEAGDTCCCSTTAASCST